MNYCVICGGEISGDHLLYCPGPPKTPAPLTNGESYTNPGKGTVLTNEGIADRLAALFNERDIWTSAELNARVGWQFSQGIYALRRRGLTIRTLRTGPRTFAYELIRAEP